MHIVVFGAGYVGTANAVMLAQFHQVTLVDINPEKIERIKKKQAPIHDDLVSQFLNSKSLNLNASLDAHDVITKADLVIVATPTDYDPVTNSFNTKSVEDVVTFTLKNNPSCLIVIKSTIPVGFTLSLRAQTGSSRILFSPEFLREGLALHDTLYPSRIIIGDLDPQGHIVAEIFKQGSLNQNVPILFTHPSEAEAIKLFSNTYLAMRVAFFNELDSYALLHDLNTRQVIEGVCLDPRIGNGYNNPSFGYGGYCLPKDTKQLLANFQNVPQNLIGAIVDANRTRKDVIAEDILKRNPKTVGIYRLVMKQGSDNFRSSAVQGIMKRLKGKGIPIVVYEPHIVENTFFNSPVIKNIDEFKQKSDLILSNRWHPDLIDVKDKVYTRDLFSKDE